MAIEGGVAMQRRAIDDGLQFVRRRDHGIAEGRGDFLELLAVERMHGKVDAEALLGAVDEFLAERGADVGIRDGLAVTHDRRHAENAELLPPRLDADNRRAGLDRLHHRVAAARNVVSENLGGMDPVERQRRRRLERDQRNAEHPVPGDRRRVVDLGPAPRQDRRGHRRAQERDRLEDAEENRRVPRPFGDLLPACGPLLRGAGP